MCSCDIVKLKIIFTFESEATPITSNLSSHVLSPEEGRLPRNYRTVLEVVRALAPGSHVSALDVYARARERAPHIGFVTVHRALARLQADGFVLKLDLPGHASAVYEQASPPHAHFRCADCGEISDVEFGVPGDRVAELAARYGLAISGESVTFTGRCARCTTPP
jgi:Fe2+ or Zn2+ uptake regulation protein